MPTYPGDIQSKLDALQALTGAERKPAEIVAVYWPSPTGTKIYSIAKYTQLSWWPELAATIETHFGTVIPITLTLIPDSTPFIDLPRAASISDDSITLAFNDQDSAFSTLLMTYGEGIRVEVFGYWPSPDLLLSLWRGLIHQPKDMNRDQVKITATSGWRAPNMLVPKRPFATSCPFIFGAFFSTQGEIDAHKGCPYNVHIGGSIGVPGFTDCPRRVKADCTERLVVATFWPGFETREDPIPNNQTKGPNLLAKSIGNESALSDPIRVIAGERYVKALYLLAFRNETDTNHPDDGFGAALFAVSEGPNQAMWEFRINGQLVGSEHFQLRLGTLGQAKTDWSPDVNSYSGTSHCYGRIQGNFDDATASDYSGSIRVLGANDVRVYSDPETFTAGYTTNRVWWLLHILAHLRWGYGQDYPRFNIESFIDAAAWCDEYVTLTDSNGNTFSGVRSTFNAEVTARAIQQQVKDICTAGRLGLPFEFEGNDVIVPLKAEDLEDTTIPVFTDEGTGRNIVYDGAKTSLSWSCISDEEMTNQWTVNFDDAANSGIDTQYIFGDQPQQLRAGRAWGDHSKRVINKSQAGYGINSAQEAARFGNSLLYLGPLDSGGILNPFSVKFTAWYADAFNVQNYKLIRVVNAKLQSRMSTYFTTRGLQPYPGADYTYFRVMKYTRKGNLRVEIEAQQYATLDIVPSEDACDWKNYAAASILFEAVPLALPGLSDGEAVGSSTNWIDQITGTRNFGQVDPDQRPTLHLTDGPNGQPFVSFDSNDVLVLSETYDKVITNTAFTVFIVFRPQRDGVNNDPWWCPQVLGTLNAYFGISLRNTGSGNKFVLWVDRVSPTPRTGFVESTTTFEQNVWYILEAWFDGSTINLKVNNDTASSLTFDGPGSLANTPLLGATGDYAGVYLSKADVGPISRDTFRACLSDHFDITLEVEASIDFGPPRDLIAVVVSKTPRGTIVLPGHVLVRFSWAPPLIHPELVTGYEMRDELDNVVMSTALVNAFSISLVPGTYTYKVRATDSIVFSAYVLVTFTATIPVGDLGLIDRVTGNVLVDRASGDTLESRAA